MTHTAINDELDVEELKLLLRKLAKGRSKKDIDKLIKSAWNQIKDEVRPLMRKQPSPRCGCCRQQGHNMTKCFYYKVPEREWTKEQQEVGNKLREEDWQRWSF